MFRNFTYRVLHPPGFGLDISDLTVKFMRLKPRGGGFAMQYFGEVSLPEGVVVGGEVKKEDELAAVLKDGLRTGQGRKVAERFCVASLPEEKSFVRVIELPNIKTEDVSHAIRWEVEGVVPLRLDEIYFDYELMPVSPEASDHRDVLIIAFPKNIVDSYHGAISRAGFKPLVLELESQAILRAVVGKDFSNQPLIVVDIGTTRTSFIIFARGSLIFTKTIPVGGRDFELAIASSLGVSPEEARRLKIEYGLSKNYLDGRLFTALSRYAESLTAEIQQQLWFYADHSAKRHKSFPDIERILLCGGDANLIGLEKYVAAAVKKMTAMADPFASLRLPAGVVPPIPRNSSLKYSTAIGLALREQSR